MGLIFSVEKWMYFFCNLLAHVLLDRVGLPLIRKYYLLLSFRVEGELGSQSLSVKIIISFSVVIMPFQF